MEAAVSAIAGELLSRLISFAVRKYARRRYSCPDEKLDRLRQLLLRVHTVVEEADARRITNSMMLAQLKLLAEGMYRGYYLLDTFKYRQEQLIIKSDHQIPMSKAADDLDSVLANLESAVANMTEFVILLAGCDKHVCRRPYDTYLYTDSFMFGRSVEKQQLINTLLQDDDPPGAPAVVPIIGGRLVGKKTLVGHACRDERVRSHFSSVLHLNADDDIIRRKKGHNNSLPTQAAAARPRTLTVIEFVSDVDDECWAEFCSSAARRMGGGSKLVVVSRVEKVARFGTVRPIRLHTLPDEEYVYLFKALAFGSADPDDHPQLARVGLEIARLLRGLLLSGNVISEMLRNNLDDVQYWRHVLRRFRTVVESNFSEFGEHPKHLIDKDRPVDITGFTASPPSVHHASLRIMPSRGVKSTVQRERSKVTFGDLVAGSRRVTALPEEEFEIVIWESRLPPYTTRSIFSVIEQETSRI